MVEGMELFTVALGTRRPNDQLGLDLADVATRLRSRAPKSLSKGLHRLGAERRWIEAELVSSEAVVGLLEAAVRDPLDWAAFMWVGRPTTAAMGPRYWLPKARTAAQWIDVGPNGLSRHRTSAVAGLLRMQLAISRGRTPAQWAVLDAMRVSKSQSEVAQLLGCSRQSVSRTLRRTHMHAEGDTAAALQLLCSDVPVAPGSVRLAA